MNTKGKEKKEKSITASEGEATKSNAHTPAREDYRDSEEKELKTKVGKGDKNYNKKISSQANETQGRQRSPKQERTSRKGRRKRRAACNDTQIDKTKRRIGKKNTGERKRKLLKKGKQGRKTKKRKAKPISNRGH